MNVLLPEMPADPSGDPGWGRDRGDLPHTSYKHTQNLNHRKKGEEFLSFRNTSSIFMPFQNEQRDKREGSSQIRLHTNDRCPPLPRAELSILYQQGDPEGKRKQSGGSRTRIITLLWTGKSNSARKSSHTQGQQHRIQTCSPDEGSDTQSHRTCHCFRSWACALFSTGQTSSGIYSHGNSTT